MKKSRVSMPIRRSRAIIARTSSFVVPLYFCSIASLPDSMPTERQVQPACFIFRTISSRTRETVE